MPDITALILDDHEAFRRAFAQLDDLHDDPKRAGDVWAGLAALLEVHASAEEEHFYPALLQVADEGEDETEDAIEDHDDIRDGIRRAAEAEAGSEDWWTAVNDARTANTEHMGEEEDDGLPDFRRNASMDLRNQLGEKFLEFKAAHPRAEGLSGEDKDPKAYIEEHS